MWSIRLWPYQGHIEADKGATPISEIAEKVIPVVHVVLDDHVPFPDSGVH